MNRKIRALVVDDSSVLRTLVTRILQADPEIEVVDTAPDPYVAREKLVQQKPDVMILDIEMPRMDGITFLAKVMQHFPVRTLIFSSLSPQNSVMALKAFEAGAIDVMEKPSLDVTQATNSLAIELRARVKAVAKANLTPQIHVRPVTRSTQPPPSTSMERTTHQVLAIASSTGGTEALKVLLSGLPSDLPGTVIVQHMPPVFTKVYAETLAGMFPFEVKEAAEGDRVQPGRALIAPGNFHMELTRSGAFYHVRLNQLPFLHGVRPAADILMKSVAKYAGANAIGVVLTGMGRDGAEGLKQMKAAGSYNIAQDEASSVVFGMPKAAIDAKAVHKVMRLDAIASEVLRQLKAKGPA